MESEAQLPSILRLPGVSTLDGPVLAQAVRGLVKDIGDYQVARIVHLHTAGMDNALDEKDLVATALCAWALLCACNAWREVMDERKRTGQRVDPILMRFATIDEFENAETLSRLLPILHLDDASRLQPVLTQWQNGSPTARLTRADVNQMKEEQKEWSRNWAERGNVGTLRVMSPLLARLFWNRLACGGVLSIIAWAIAFIVFEVDSSTAFWISFSMFSLSLFVAASLLQKSE